MKLIPAYLEMIQPTSFHQVYKAVLGVLVGSVFIISVKAAHAWKTLAKHRVANTLQPHVVNTTTRVAE